MSPPPEEHRNTKTIFRHGDGDANKPDDFVSSVEETVADGKATVVSSAWYTINGVRVAEPKQRGIYIRRDKMSDGTVKAVKVMMNTLVPTAVLSS